MIGVIILILFSIRIATQHFIRTPDEVDCDAARLCNHTWVPICGQDQHDRNDRLFLDECDMYEYNCDNRRTYIKVELNTCSYKCTSGQGNFYPPHVETSAIPHTTKRTTTNENIITDASTTTETTTPQTTITTTALKLKSSTLTETNTVAFEANTIETVADNETEENITSANAESDTTKINNNFDEVYSEETTTMTHETEKLLTTNTENTTAATKNGTCYPKDCFVPSTWETTHITEFRDFYQILKQRFGDNIKLLKDTTHFPKIAVERTGGGFIPGQHDEKISNNIV